MKRLLSIVLICLPLVAFAGGPYLFVVISKSSSGVDKRKVRRKIQKLGGDDTNRLVWANMRLVHAVGNTNQKARMVSLDFKERDFDIDLTRIYRWASNNLAEPNKFRASTGYVSSVALSNIGVRVFDPEPLP